MRRAWPYGLLTAVVWNAVNDHLNHRRPVTPSSIMKWIVRIYPERMTGIVSVSTALIRVAGEFGLQRRTGVSGVEYV